MKYLIASCLFLLSGCGVISSLTDFDDELTGIPVRDLNEPVPGRSDLPTPADARKINPEGIEIFSSIGFYSNGKIWSRWVVIPTVLWDVRASTIKNRFNYASFYLWYPFNDAVKTYYALEPSAEKIMIWDISKEFGGPSSNHISHELGLDVDVRYPLIDSSKRSDPGNVDKLKAWSMAMAFVSTGEIGRIFTFPELKAFFCKNKTILPGDQTLKFKTLKSLRPWPNHTDHFHFRFKCADPDKLCVDQIPVAGGDGC